MCVTCCARQRKLRANSETSGISKISATNRSSAIRRSSGTSNEAKQKLKRRPHHPWRRLYCLNQRTGAQWTVATRGSRGGNKRRIQLHLQWERVTEWCGGDHGSGDRAGDEKGEGRGTTNLRKSFQPPVAEVPVAHGVRTMSSWEVMATKMRMEREGGCGRHGLMTRQSGPISRCSVVRQRPHLLPCMWTMVRITVTACGRRGPTMRRNGQTWKCSVDPQHPRRPYTWIVTQVVVLVVMMLTVRGGGKVGVRRGGRREVDVKWYNKHIPIVTHTVQAPTHSNTDRTDAGQLYSTYLCVGNGIQ